MTSRETARAVPSSDGHDRGLESIIVGWLFYRNSANGASPMDKNLADCHREWVWTEEFVKGSWARGKVWWDNSPTNQGQKKTANFTM